MAYRQSKVYGITRPGTPGLAPGLDAYVVRKVTTLDQIAGFSNFSWPYPLLDASVSATTPVFPSTAADDTPQARWARVAAFKRRAGSDSWFLGKPLALDIIDDSVIAPIRRELDSQDWRKFRTLRWSRSAGSALLPNAAPVFPERIPASTYSDTMCRLLSEIQRHLLEPVVDGGLTWSPPWDAAGVLNLVNERLVRFLLETGIIRTRVTLSVTAGSPSATLPSDTIDIRRVAWNSGASVSGLTRLDPFGMDAGSVGWQSASGTPYAYIEEPLTPLVVKLVNTPSANGTLDVLYVQAPTVTGVCSLAIPIPAMFVPHVKYGVLADILNAEGESQDPIRAEYCEQRFAEGVELGKLLLGFKS